MYHKNNGTSGFQMEEKMALNLRNSIQTPIQNLATLFRERQEDVNRKSLIEDKITSENGKLTQGLQCIFKPLAVRTGIGFNLSIRDKDVEISTQFNLLRKTKKNKAPAGTFRVCLSTIPIAEWMADPLAINSYLILIETNLRLLSRLSRNSRKEGKISFTVPTTVTISIDTRNRYFQ